MSTARICLLILAAAAALASTACRRDDADATRQREARACDNLAEVGRKLGHDEAQLADQDACLVRLRRMTRQCQNPDAILDCIARLDANTDIELRDEVGACARACEPR